MGGADPAEAIGARRCDAGDAQSTGGGQQRRRHRVGGAAEPHGGRGAGGPSRGSLGIHPRVARTLTVHPGFRSALEESWGFKTSGGD